MREEMETNTKSIQEALCKQLAESRYEAICENFPYRFEMDVAALSKSRILSEYEVKISRSDFLADRKKGKKWAGKSKFEVYATEPENSPNYFFYVCPADLIKEHEVPSFAGLIYVANGELVHIKHAKRIHKQKAREGIENKMLRYHTQRKYLGGTMLTYLNRKSKEWYNRFYDENDNPRVEPLPASPQL